MAPCSIAAPACQAERWESRSRFQIGRPGSLVHTLWPWEVITMAVDARYRDKGGEIGRKYGDTLIGKLRISYGSGFAKACANDDKLSDVLAKLDKRSLYKLVRDYNAGMLSIRLRTPWVTAPSANE